MAAFLAWVIIGVLIILAMIAAAIWVWRGEKKRDIDYYGFFIMGIVWAVVGIPMGNYPLFALGMVFAVTGLANKSKWKKPKPWKKMKKEEKRRKLVFFALIVSLMAAALFVFFMLE